MKPWYVYIIRNKLGLLYTGISTDCHRRLAEHNRGVGAKYTRGRGPWSLVHYVQVAGRVEASKLERKVKSLPSSQKVEYLQMVMEA